jgi:hypothetical protein
LKRLIIIFSILFFLKLNCFAQIGHYLTTYFCYQYSNLANTKDHWSPKFQYKRTYHPCFGLKYNYNFTNIVGLETGIKYSYQGQKYTGYIEVDGNTGDTINTNFNSSVELNFIEVPLMLTFNTPRANSDGNEDIYFVSISAGIQGDYLNDAKMTVSPDLPEKYKTEQVQKDFNKLFNSFTVSFCGDLSLMLKLYKKLYLNSSIFASKTISDIENKSFSYDKKIHPLEYVFPVSVKKESYPASSVRYKTKNVVFGLRIGITYKF